MRRNFLFDFRFFSRSIVFLSQFRSSVWKKKIKYLLKKKLFFKNLQPFFKSSKTVAASSIQWRSPRRCGNQRIHTKCWRWFIDRIWVWSGWEKLRYRTSYSRCGAWSRILAAALMLMMILSAFWNHFWGQTTRICILKKIRAVERRKLKDYQFAT